MTYPPATSTSTIPSGVPGVGDARADIDLAGLPVVDAAGRRLGEARTVVTDHVAGRYRFLVVTSGGLLGLPMVERLIPLPTVGRVDRAVHVDRSYDIVRRCRIPDTILDDLPACAAVYAHYCVGATDDGEHAASQG